MIIEDMNKQERTAWLMLAGTGIIATWLTSSFIRLLAVENGTLTNAPGMIPLILKAVAVSIAFEIAATIILRRTRDTVEMDERDRLIAFKATNASYIAFGVIAGAAVFNLIPWGDWHPSGINAVATSTMGGALICMFTLASVVRYAGQILQYRMGL